MTILITGASGLIATELILMLLENTSHNLVLLSRNSLKLRSQYTSYINRIECFDLERIIKLYPIPTFDVVIHTAFARSSSGEEIANSLEYLNSLCQWLNCGHIRKFINISSQSVYGNNYLPGLTEKGPCKPDYMYALGKYSSELIASAWFNNHLLNIRLSSVCEYARFLKIFVEKALNNECIKLVAPEQIVSFIDVRDVARALSYVIEDETISSGTFNLGTGDWYTINDVLEIIRKVGITHYNLPNVNVEITDNGNRSTVGMCVDSFKDSFKWEPEYNIEDMVISLYEMLNNANGGGGYPQAFKIVYQL